ncbi:MAG: ABC transporter ATP-binding protein [bacterium]|nr:ABC transporter ATP-binding protein [bacterium]MYJ13999.1 ABC transporter ATP-binding protein [Acidimicrobiia bacterium]
MAEASAEPAPAPREAPLLTVDGVSLAFGGLTALDDVSFSVRPGELVALIGPNGAGKTSLFNSISGVYRPQRGALVFEGTDLVGMRPSRIAAAGVARTFQNLALFENLDVIDNLMLGRHTLMRTGLLAGAVWLGRARREEIRHRRRCAELVDFLGLGGYVGRPAGLLPYGVQKRVEMGRALAAEPRLLMLDEPVAGMTRGERDEAAELLKGIRAEMGLTMLLVEHHMHLVLQAADRVVAMNFGAVIASGAPEAVANHPAVIEAYLGAGGNASDGAGGNGAAR